MSGGTLAALPFRRYQSSQDASIAPAAVSGPSNSALDSHPSTDPVQMAAVTPSLDSLPTWDPAPAPTQSRQPDIPLTYEDLALPVDQPAAIERRFNATARVQEQRLQNQRGPSLSTQGQRIGEPAHPESFVMPSMDSLTMEQHDQLESLPAPTFPSPNESTAGGRLASATPPESTFPTQPTLPTQPIFQDEPTYQSQPETRQHHWIRQP